MVDAINGAGLIAALALAALAVALVGGRHAAASATVMGAPAALMTTLPDGRVAVIDAGGVAVPVHAYQRIASLGLVSDALLPELCEPQRVVAYSAFTSGRAALPLGATPRLPGLNDLESIIALRPDLLLVTTFAGDADRVARLREAGITVFDLGPARGMSTLVANSAGVAAVIGAPDRGRDHASALTRRMARVAAGLGADRRRPRALSLSLVLDQVYGGTIARSGESSSYHDVLVAAGLIDAAAGRFASAWPQYAVEDIIAIDPDLVVLPRGQADDIRRLPGFATLRALRDPHGVVEIDGDLFSHPGPLMLEAAEAVFVQVHGE